MDLFQPAWDGKSQISHGGLLIGLRQPGTRSLYFEKKVKEAKQLAPWSRRCPFEPPVCASLLFLLRLIYSFFWGFANVFFQVTLMRCTVHVCLYPEIKYKEIEVIEVSQRENLI